MKITFKAQSDKVKVLGRTKIINDIRYIDYSNSGIEFEFTGTSVSAVLCTDISEWNEDFRAWVAVFIDDEETPSKRFSLNYNEALYNLYENSVSRKVKIKLLKMSENAFAKAGIKEIIVEGDADITPVKASDSKIEFIGDSITCGYGAEGIWNTDVFKTSQENAYEAYAAKTARYFNADFNCISWSGIGIISSWTEVDAPNTEWLMPMLYKYTDAAMDKSLGKTESEYEVWDNNKFQPDLIVINLGTNDTSYTKGINERIAEFEKGYYNLLNQVRNSNPDSEIICTLGAMGQDLCLPIKNAVDRFKTSYNDIKVHTMFFDVQLESDGIGTDWHPSLITHDKMSKKLISEIKEVMNW